MKPPVELVADASSVINILATGRGEEILALWRATLILTEFVDGEIKRNRSELERLYALGRVRTRQLPALAFPLFTRAAAEVDDGEASAIALAMHESGTLVTDDIRAKNVWRAMVGPEGGAVHDTCELLQRLETQLERTVLREILMAMETGARFRPPRAHASWWARVVSPTLPQ
ncbi:MAG: hypothetical protein R3B70_14395 [Polyangiaceae bacterium]